MLGAFIPVKYHMQLELDFGDSQLYSEIRSIPEGEWITEHGPRRRNLWPTYQPDTLVKRSATGSAGRNPNNFRINHITAAAVFYRTNDQLHHLLDQPARTLIWLPPGTDDVFVVASVKDPIEWLIQARKLDARAWYKGVPGNEVWQWVDCWDDQFQCWEGLEPYITGRPPKESQHLYTK